MFFQMLSLRYEHSATIPTCSKPFADGGDVSGDEVMAAALIEGPLHLCHIMSIRGNSYGTCDHRALANRLMPLAPPPDGERRLCRHEAGPSLGSHRDRVYSSFR